MNRGIGQRPIFENRTDCRKFESLLARAARRGDIEIHNYTLVPNHYHLMAFSPAGRLSHAVAWFQREFTRYFNRSRGRRGPLFEGRFLSKPANGLAYRSVLVRYIDDNPVDAGIVAHRSEYPYGAAWRLYRNLRRPWISRWWIDREVARVSPKSVLTPEWYEVRFPSDLSPAIRDWVTRRLQPRYGDQDDLSDLIGAAPEHIRRWFEERTWLADGSKPGMPAVPVELAIEALERRRGQIGRWPIRGARGAELDAWEIMRAAILREVCGLSFREISIRSHTPISTAQDRVRTHVCLLLQGGDYADQCVRVTANAVGAVSRAAGVS